VYVIIGIFCQIIQGTITSGFGVFIIKNLFAMMNNYADMEKMREEVNTWCAVMFGCSIISLIGVSTSKYVFGVVGENITLNVR
jgi:hypothetical protein